MKASILINNYNYGRFISEAINSALSQDYDDIEVIVYDDGSTDDSLVKLAKFGNRIKVISNKNFGKLPTLNQTHAIEEAFKLSSGDIIFLLDSDDLFSLGKVSKIMNIFKNNLNAICVQHTFKLIDKDGKDMQKKKRPIISGIKLPEAIFFTGRLDLFFSQTSALAFRRGFLDRVLPLKEDSYTMLWPDLRLTRIAMFTGDIITLQEQLGSYRLHGSNWYASKENKESHKKFSQQYVDFFNTLTHKYLNREFEYSARFWSLLKVGLVVLNSKMSLKEKFIFFKTLLLKK